MSKQKPTDPPPDRPCDEGRRYLFNLLLGPLRSAVRGYDLPPDATSNNPPTRKKVIRGGADGHVLALLGPLARSEAPGGYRFQGARVEEDHIVYRFARVEGERIEVRLDSVRLPVEGPEYRSRSFRIRVDGDAPEADRRAVADRVAREIAARDDGRLWVEAAQAPLRGDGTRR